jgi:hypothetical protein
VRWRTVLARRADRARWLLSDALLFARVLVAQGPLGATRAARRLRLDRERFTCHAGEGECQWEGCPLSPGAARVPVPAGVCFLTGAP